MHIQSPVLSVYAKRICSQLTVFARIGSRKMTPYHFVRKIFLYRMVRRNDPRAYPSKNCDLKIHFSLRIIMLEATVTLQYVSLNQKKQVHEFFNN